jgi:hypothetical protein
MANNYGNSTSKNLSTINNIYTGNQPIISQTSFGHIEAQSGFQEPGQVYAKKYGTSF